MRARSKRLALIGVGLPILGAIACYSWVDYTSFPNAGPIVFPDYDEQSEWEQEETDRFTIWLPRDWSLGEPITSDTSDPKHPYPTEVVYQIFKPEGTVAMIVTTVERGGHFIECFCGGRGGYLYSRINGNKLWYGMHWSMIDMDDDDNPIELDEPNLDGVTFKAGGKHFSADIHCRFFEIEDHDPELLIHLSQSMRAK